MGGDQHIDAVCIRGNSGTVNDSANAVYYSGGGFCAGIIYVGSLSSQSEPWAAWVSDEDFDDFTTSNGFASLVDDTDNWRTDSTSFSVTWDLNRWLPREERNLDYYSNEYRFVTGDPVEVYSYQYTNDALHSKTM